jgi:tRNA dimethylallyltransferase
MPSRSTSWSGGSADEGHHPASLMAQRSETVLIVLAGPTGVGKTRIAVELCRRLGGEIVGADSMQVYRGFDIGSGKPSRAELAGVRHHLVDILEPEQPIDAASFTKLADAAIDEVTARARTPFVVGGTGLWLRALLRGLLQLPAVDPTLRARLEQEWLELGASAMHARLREVDPRTAAAVHASDRLRVVRALEVHDQTGHALGELRAAHGLGRPRYRALMLVLDLPSAGWRAAIAERARGMFARGWVAEVEALITRYGSALKPLRSVGYRQIAAGLNDGCAQQEIELRVVQATHLYGKRQRNWFRTDPSVDLRVQADAVLEPAMLATLRDHLSSG